MSLVKSFEMFYLLLLFVIFFFGRLCAPTISGEVSVLGFCNGLVLLVGYVGFFLYYVRVSILIIGLKYVYGKVKAEGNSA